MRIPVVRTYFQSGSKGMNGFVSSADLPKSQAQVIIPFRVAGLQTYGLAIQRQRFGLIPLFMKNHAKVVIRFGVGWPYLNRRQVMSLGLFIHSSLFKGCPY